MAVHTGVRGPGHLSRVSGWSPAALGASLLGWWDAERTDLITLSGSSVTSWADVVAGYAATQGVTASRPRWNAAAFGGVQNIVPWSQDASQWATFSGATVTADVVAAPDGTQTADQIALSTAAYRYASTGASQPVSTYTASCYVRATAPTSAMFRVTRSLSGANEAKSTIAVTTSWQRVSLTFTTTAVDTIIVGWDQRTATGGPGTSATVYVWGLQVEQASAASQYVPTAGAAVYAFGRPGVIFDGADDEVSLPSVPFPTGAGECEVWALVDQTAPASDATLRVALGYGNDTNSCRRIRRQVISSVNRGTTVVGQGASAVTVADTAVDLTGRHVIRSRIEAATAYVAVDGNATTSAAATPSTGTSVTRIGGTETATASSFWQGQVAAVLVTAPLSAAQAASLTAYLKARGGIA